MTNFNDLHGNKTTNSPRECNIQPPSVHCKSLISPPKTSPVVSDIMEKINHHAIDYDDDEVQPSDYPPKSTSESFPDTDTTPIKSIDDDDDMDQLLELFHSEHDDDILDDDLHMLQALLLADPYSK